MTEWILPESTTPLPQGTHVSVGHGSVTQVGTGVGGSPSSLIVDQGTLVDQGVVVS